MGGVFRLLTGDCKSASRYRAPIRESSMIMALKLLTSFISEIKHSRKNFRTIIMNSERGVGSFQR